MRGAILFVVLAPFPLLLSGLVGGLAPLAAYLCGGAVMWALRGVR